MPLAEHDLNVQLISGNALIVLERLRDAGYEAYLVGGSVRDLLLNLTPKDFDVTTDASPEQIKKVFKNCRLIGRRFRLAHVLFGREVIEVATFRADHQQGEGGQVESGGRILRDNVFGSIEEDARRRDFSVNALYFCSKDSTIIDYVGALEDIEKRTLKLIGDPEVRCAEDPVRCLRAARFSAKLGFSLDNATEKAVIAQAHLLRDIPPARLFEETLKMFHSGHAVESLEQLCRLDLLQYLFPVADACLKAGDKNFEKFVTLALQNTDLRLKEGKPVTPAFLYAVMLWPETMARAKVFQTEEPPVPALLRAADEVLRDQLKFTSLPKRFSIPMREIWAMQPRLENYLGKRALRMLSNSRFRAGYDFLCLRSKVSVELSEKCQWWTEIQISNPVTPVRPTNPRNKNRFKKRPVKAGR